MVTPSLPYRTTAWFTACLSCLVLVGLAALTAIISSEWASAIAHHKLATAFKDQNWPKLEVERYLIVLVERPHINPLLSALVYAGSSAASEESRELYRVVSSFRLGQEQAAVDSARILIANMEQDLEDLPSGHASPHFEALLVEARNSLTNYAAEQREMRKKLGAQSQAQAEFGRLASQLILVGNDLGELLSLTPAHGDPKLGPVDVYQEGVLKDLPKLKGLPDGIPDLVALRNELERVGGAVRIEGENQHETFTKRLAELRNVSRQIVSRRANLELEIKTRNDEIEALTARLGLSSTALRNALEEFFVTQTRPKFRILGGLVRHSVKEKAARYQ